jgi:hypothetical protein
MIRMLARLRRSRPRRSTLRTRVTVVASLAITAAVVLGLLLMYLLQMNSVRSTVDGQLRTYATQIAQSAANGRWPTPLAPSTLDSNAEAQVIAPDGRVQAGRAARRLPAARRLGHPGPAEGGRPRNPRRGPRHRLPRGGDRQPTLLCTSSRSPPRCAWQPGPGRLRHEDRRRQNPQRSDALSERPFRRSRLAAHDRRRTRLRSESGRTLGGGSAIQRAPTARSRIRNKPSARPRYARLGATPRGLRQRDELCLRAAASCRGLFAIHPDALSTPITISRGAVARPWMPSDLAIPWRVASPLRCK